MKGFLPQPGPQLGHVAASEDRHVPEFGLYSLDGGRSRVRDDGLLVDRGADAFHEASGEGLYEIGVLGVEMDGDKMAEGRVFEFLADQELVAVEGFAVVIDGRLYRATLKGLQV